MVFMPDLSKIHISNIINSTKAHKIRKEKHTAKYVRDILIMYHSIKDIIQGLPLHSPNK